MLVKKDEKNFYIKKFWLVYPLFLLKMLIYYWQTDRLDMMKRLRGYAILTFLFYSPCLKGVPWGGIAQADMAFTFFIRE